MIALIILILCILIEDEIVTATALLAGVFAIIAKLGDGVKGADW